MWSICVDTGSGENHRNKDYYLQVGDGGDGREWVLLQQTLLVQELSCSAVKRWLEETVVQNI